MKSYERLIRAIVDEPWAIEEKKLAAICEFIRLKSEGVDLSAYEAASRPEERRVQNIAVLPLFGVLANRTNMVTSFSGGTSLEKFSNDFTALVRDPEVGAIILDIDSPGGSVSGVEEAGGMIAAAAKQKGNIVAYANATAASAAYWLGSQANEFWVTPSGQVGSIGVVAVHQDVSQAMESAGIKTTFITAGKFKAEGASERPLTEEARDFMQLRVEEYYDAFVKAVARGRKATEKEVRNGFGQGRTVGAREAMQTHMVDHVGTLDDVLTSVSRGMALPHSKARAEIQAPPITANYDVIEIQREEWARESYRDGSTGRRGDPMKNFVDTPERK